MSQRAGPAGGVVLDYVLEVCVETAAKTIHGEYIRIFFAPFSLTTR